MLRTARHARRGNVRLGQRADPTNRERPRGVSAPAVSDPHRRARARTRRSARSARRSRTCGHSGSPPASSRWRAPSSISRRGTATASSRTRSRAAWDWTAEPSFRLASSSARCSSSLCRWRVLAMVAARLVVTELDAPAPLPGGPLFRTPWPLIVAAFAALLAATALGRCSPTGVRARPRWRR